MDRISNRIETLGFEKCFLENIDPADLDKFDIARVTAVHKDSYIIHNGKNEMFAEQK
jgi:ribosome biogenesis GTPase